MLDKNQTGGDFSNNFQSEKIEINYGLTYSEAKEIALDVFRNNFTILKNEAAEIAEKRATEISEKILEKIFKDLPNAIESLKTPGFQDAMYLAQKAYAKSGDEPTRDLLVELLSERSKTNHRDLIQIIIDEALSIIPKITSIQLDLLTLNYLIAGRHHQKTPNIDFIEDFANLLSPFSSPLDRQEGNNAHLIYLGCAYSKNVIYSNFEKLLLNNYRAIFNQSFSKNDFESIFGSIEKYSTFVKQLQNSDQYKIIASNLTGLEIGMKSEAKFTINEINSLKQFCINLTLSEKQLKEKFLNFDGSIKNTISYWNSTKFKDLELTEIGIYLAKINYKFKTGNELKGMRFSYK